MEEEILNFEKLSRLLEPSATERASVREKVVTYSEEFLEKIEEADAYKAEFKRDGSPLESITDETADIEELIEFLRERVDYPRLNPASGGHMGFIPGGGLYYSALGDYLADVFNRYAGLFSAGPGAVRMENMLIRWMAEIVGFPEDAAGNLTTGGSLAHLIAIVTARDAKKIHSAGGARPVVYFSEQHHHSLDKALRVAGLKGECEVHQIPIDERCRMIASELEERIELDKKAGLNPFLAVATAGTTDVGAVDPLEDIGVICRKHGLWYHVDAAYGGFFILTDKGKEKLRGIELADSVVMDPHKGLFLPYGLGVILVRDRQALYNSFYHEADYIPPSKDGDEPSPGDYSPELTKHFRGLRLWLPLKLFGLKPFRACLDEKLLLAKYFHSKIKELGFQVHPEMEPDLSVVAYRFVPKAIEGDLVKENRFNEDLLEKVNADGRVFISDTKLDETRFLRFACLSFRTHLNNIKVLLEILKEQTESLIGYEIPGADLTHDV